MSPFDLIQLPEELLNTLGIERRGGDSDEKRQNSFYV